MKKQRPFYLLLSVFLILLFINRGYGQYIQSLEIDLELEENSTRWGIGTIGIKNKIRLATFGPYSVTGVQKLDSGASKNKIKEENRLGYKVMRVERNAVFRMNISCESDDTETLFSLFTATREQSGTAFGVASELFQNREKSFTGSEILDRKKHAEGIVFVKNDSSLWKFYFGYPGSNKSLFDEGLLGYLTNGVDSFTMKVLYTMLYNSVHETARGVSLMNSQEEQIAALIFKTSTVLSPGKSENYTNDELVMINKNINKPARLAIGSLFAVMIGFQKY